MQPVLDFLKSVFFFHKLKIFLFFLFSFVFFLILFPLTDLGEKVVSETAANGIYLEFENMDLRFFPRPAVVMEKVMVENAMIDSIEVERLTVTPSILSLIQFAVKKKLPIGADVDAQGLWEGHVELSLSGSSKIKDPMAMNIEIQTEALNVKKLVQALAPQWPTPPNGLASLKADVDLDPSMKTQPDGSVDLNATSVQMPQFEIPTGFGSLPMPGLSFQKISLKGQMKNGRLNIKEATLGSAQDEIFLKVSGDVDLRLLPGGTPIVSLYRLAVDLTMKKSMQSKLGSTAAALDSFLGKFNSGSRGDSQRYAFRVEGSGFMTPPALSPL